MKAGHFMMSAKSFLFFAAWALLFPLLALAPLPAAAGVEGALRMATGYGNALDQKNLNDFYTLRRFAPAWQLDRNTPQGMKEFVQYIRNLLHEHGLNEDTYPLAQFEQRAA